MGIRNYWDNLVILKDVITERPKLSLFVTLLLVGFVSLMVVRVPDWWTAVKVENDLNKQTSFSWLTGKCIVNNGTQEREDWVYCDRLLGVSGNDGVDEGEL